MRHILSLILTLFVLNVLGQNVKISDMPAASSLTGTELVPVVQSGINKKATVSQFVSGYVPNTRTITINGTAYDLSANRSWSVGNVFTSGIYSNPVWITSLAAGKITGTVSILQGGSGQTTANAALNAFLPTQTGNNGKVLQTDGTNTSWQVSSTLSGSGTTNELTYWTSSTALGSLTTATYPSLTELSYVKGLTSAAQTQLDTRWNYGTASTQTWTAAQNYAMGGNDAAFLNGDWLLGPTGATITANTRSDIRGQGTTTAFIQRLANSANTFRWGINDQGDITHTGKYAITGSTLSGSSLTDNWLNITGTMPSVMAASTFAAVLNITGSGSSDRANQAFRVDYLAGYTGVNQSVAGVFIQRNAGTGNNLLWTTNFTSPSGNSGVNALVVGTTTGLNVGGFYEAGGGNLNVGIFGKATSDKANGINVGVIGQGLNPNATVPISVGGWFTLAVTAPTYVSAALVADNAATTNPIFLARDNGTTVVTIADGGLQTNTAGLNLSGASSPLQVGGSAGTSGQVLTSAGAGATPTWGTPSSGITVGTTTITSGTDTRVGFNDGGVYAEDANFTWDKTNNRLGVSEILSTTTLSISAATTNSLTLNGGSTSGGVSLTAFGPFGGAGTAILQAAYNGSGFTSTIPHLRLSNQTTGTGASGTGFGIMFHARTGASNLEEGAFIEAILTDATAASEDFDLVFRNMAAGATADEKLRITSTGNLDVALGKMLFDATETAGGDTGNKTINKPSGSVNIAAAGTTVTVTNSFCTTSSHVFAIIETNDATAYVKNVVPGSGSFVVTLGAAATAEVRVSFWVIN